MSQTFYLLKCILAHFLFSICNCEYLLSFPVRSPWLCKCFLKNFPTICGYALLLYRNSFLRNIYVYTWVWVFSPGFRCDYIAWLVFLLIVSTNAKLNCDTNRTHTHTGWGFFFHLFLYFMSTSSLSFCASS